MLTDPVQPAPELFTDGASWPAPPDRIQELIAATCTALLADPDRAIARVDEVVDATLTPVVGDDPSLLALVRGSNRGNLLHWTEWNTRHPGQRVPPRLDAATLDVARDIVRRGLDETASLSSYRRGQGVAWLEVMRVVFEVTDDPDELRALLDVAARSIFTFVDDTITAIQAQVEGERRALTTGSQATMRATAQLLLEGAPLSLDDAERRLRYPIRSRSHTAAIVWAEGASAELEATVTRTARAAGAGGHLQVIASVGTRWVWFPVPAEALADAWDLPDGHRAAVGLTRHGLEGFRASHADAVATRSLMGPVDAHASFADVQVAALAGADPSLAADFVRRVLGDLADLPADDVLVQTVRTYLRTGSSAAETARRTFTHRNTTLQRLKRVADLLPQPLDAHPVEVAVALELHRWPR